MQGVDQYVAQQHQAPSSDFGWLTVHGPMTVDGDLTVCGDLKVHGPMTANRIVELQASPAPLTSVQSRREIHGPLALSGSVIVAHYLEVHGPLAVRGVLSTCSRENLDAR